MYLAASLLNLGLSYGQRALLIGSSGPQYLISLMALHRIGAKAIIMGPGDLTTIKREFIITKNLDCRLIAFDRDNMTDSQLKQLTEGIEELVQHNVENGRDPQIIVSLKDQLKQNKEKNTMQQEQSCPAWDRLVYTYQDLLKHGQSQKLTKLLETQAKVEIDDEVVALFTTGSTGEPKIVQHTAQSLASFLAGSSVVRFESRVKFYLDRPLCWAGGYVFGHTPLLSNITLVYVPIALAVNEQSIEKIFKIWEKEKIRSLLFLSVILINKLLKDKMHLKYDLSHRDMYVEWATLPPLNNKSYF